MSDERKMDNLTMRIFLETLENTVGPGGLKSILNFARLQKYIEELPPQNDGIEIPLQDVRSLVAGLTELFGEKGARALQFRAGREFVRVGVVEAGTMAKALLAASHLLPENRRMRLALEKYAEESEKRLPSEHRPRIEVREEEDHFLIIEKSSTESEGLVSQSPVCNIYAGLLYGLVEWITGHPHTVEEIECRAQGCNADVFRVSKARKLA
ncbi:MAG: hypothetical protein HXS52_08625 [Theionarchaea archaeon]|nr:hypothetical protein [Theionarchaea archaeon]MBU7037983.1 hypothetical protein [Theionarchaea archaeon]